MHPVPRHYTDNDISHGFTSHINTENAWRRTPTTSLWEGFPPGKRAYAASDSDAAARTRAAR